MALTKEDLEQVGDYVKAHLDEWASERVLGIGERLGNVESELKSQREFMIARFDAIDERFDGIDERLDGMDRRMDGMDRRMDRMDERFDGIDQRLDRMDERFDGIDQRLDRMDERLDGIDQRLDRMDERFDGIDQRLDHASDERLDGIDQRLDRMDERFDDIDRRLDGIDERFELVDYRFQSIDQRFEEPLYEPVVYAALRSDQGRTMNSCRTSIASTTRAAICASRSPICRTVSSSFSPSRARASITTLSRSTATACNISDGSDRIGMTIMLAMIGYRRDGRAPLGW